jgi:hypothetical protein
VATQRRHSSRAYLRSTSLMLLLMRCLRFRARSICCSSTPRRASAFGRFCCAGALIGGPHPERRTRFCLAGYIGGRARRDSEPASHKAHREYRTVRRSSKRFGRLLARTAKLAATRAALVESAVPVATPTRRPLRPTRWSSIKLRRAGLAAGTPVARGVLGAGVGCPIVGMAQIPGLPRQDRQATTPTHRPARPHVAGVALPKLLMAVAVPPRRMRSHALTSADLRTAGREMSMAEGCRGWFLAGPPPRGVAGVDIG